MRRVDFAALLAGSLIVLSMMPTPVSAQRRLRRVWAFFGLLRHVKDGREHGTRFRA